MPRQSGSKARAAACAALLVAACAEAPAAPASASLRFDDVFASARPESLHYTATFAAAPGKPDRMEGWRDGDARVKRRTGDALESYAVRSPGGEQYDLTMLDLQRKLLTRITRTNLYRLGNFTDWFDLAHALRHPKGDYQLAAGQRPAGVGPAVAPCTWFDLAQQGRTAHICWSARAQLPLRIVDAGGRTVWNVTRLDLGPVADTVFRIDARDYVQVDANQDMERD